VIQIAAAPLAGPLDRGEAAILNNYVTRTAGIDDKVHPNSRAGIPIPARSAGSHGESVIVASLPTPLPGAPSHPTNMLSVNRQI
jgi:hypothetical protein